MSEEIKTETDGGELPAWRRFVGKWKAAIVAAVGVVLGVLAGETGVVDGVVQILKTAFGG